MTRSSELLPCPFCGGKAIIEDNDPPDGELWWFNVGCGSCNCVIDDCFDAEAEAIAAWNTRATTPTPPKQREE